MEFVFLFLATVAAVGAQECQVPAAMIQCNKPQTQMQLSGFISNAPLFQDACIDALCVGKSKNIVMEASTKETFEPFSGKMSCQPNEVITGLELCFQVELRYISPFCTRLEEGYNLDMDNLHTVSNSVQMPNEMVCPDDMALISLELQQDDEGNINVSGECANVLEL